MVAGASGHVIARWGCVADTAILGRDLSEAESEPQPFQLE
jgi:hypothetical protein